MIADRVTRIIFSTFSSVISPILDVYLSFNLLNAIINPILYSKLNLFNNRESENVPLFRTHVLNTSILRNE